jgi:hypothetical protein
MSKFLKRQRLTLTKSKKGALNGQILPDLLFIFRRRVLERLKPKNILLWIGDK